MKILFRIALLLNFSLFLTHCSEDEPKVLPTLSLDDATANEGGELLFTITLDKPSTDTVVVHYKTQDVTTSANDYFAVANALKVKINPGLTTATVGISSKTDASQESDETFAIILSEPKNATIADGEGVGTIKNSAVQTVSYFMKAKIGTQQWNAKVGGFFGAAFIGNTFAGYGTDNDSQLSFIFKKDPPTAGAYGLEEIMATANDKVAVFYSPKFFSEGMLGQTFNGQPGGQVVITKYDATAKIVEGTFSFTGKDNNGTTLQVTEGSFKVPIE
ncbi:MAG TPA: Calx-beta domain-containing protein [Chryseosolibacter sp.]